MRMEIDAISRRLRRRIDRVVRGRTDLLALFEHEIRAEHISESLHSCNDTDPAPEAFARMESKGFDVLGIRRESEGRSVMYGYVRRQDLSGGLCEQYVRPFTAAELIADATPLVDAMGVLKDQERVFTIGRTVHGILTRADLQKAPVRLLLFGLVSALETAMLEEIRREYPETAWSQHVSRGRLAAAITLLEQRRQRNEEIDLADCLQLCDKRSILIRSKEHRERLGFPSKRAAEETLVAIERLRDRLAHSQDLVAGSDWPTVLSLVERMEELVARMTN